MYNSVVTRCGRFELLHELGRGLKSTVYFARDPEIERSVALKVFNEPPASTEAFAARVKAASNLSHLGIAKVFDVSYTEPDGLPYLVLEYVDGKSLESVLSRRGKIPQAEALALTLELLQALAYAHSLGVHHHNLKTTNLIVTPENHLKITDFVATRNSGTAFLAPEQLNGPGDQRSDLFSVGVILYLMVSGHRPFQGNTDATISFKLVHQHPVPVAAMDLDLSPELDFVIARLLAKNPDERYQTAQDAIRDIEGIREALNTGSSFNPIPAVPSRQTTGQTTSRTVTPAAPAKSGKRSTGGWILRFSVAVVVILLPAISVLRPLLQPVPVLEVSFPSRITVPPFATEKTAQARKSSTRGSRVTMPIQRATLSAPSTVSALTAKPVTRLISVPVEIRQPFARYAMSIWVDDKLTFDNEIQPEKKKRFLHMGSASMDYLTLIQVPVGDHSVRVQLKAVGEKYEGAAQLSAKFSEVSGQKLLVKCDKTRNQLQVDLN